MRESVQGIGDVDVAAIVAILLAGRQAARFRKPADRLVETDEEIRATGRALRARLREAGCLDRGVLSL